MGDGTTKIFVNIKGKYDKMKPEMKALLNYLNSGRATDNFTKELDSEVSLAKHNPHWRDEFMTLYEHYQMERYEGRKEGIAEGRASELRRIVENMLNKSIPLEEACDMVGIDVSEYEKIKNV